VEGEIEEGSSGGESHLSVCNLDKTAEFIQPQLKYGSAGVLMAGREGGCSGLSPGTVAGHGAIAWRTGSDTARGTPPHKVLKLGPLGVFKRS